MSDLGPTCPHLAQSCGEVGVDLRSRSRRNSPALYGSRTAVLLATIASLVSIFLFAGCGNSGGSPVDRAFGGLSSSDHAAMQRVLRDIKRASAAYTAVIAKAQTESNPDVLQPDIDRMRSNVDDASDEVIGIDSDDLRSTLDDYVGRMEGLVDTVQRLAVADASADQDQLLVDFQRAVRRVQAGDRALLGRIAKYMTPEQRAKLQETVKRAREKFYEAVGG